jgi:hypothetical protein
MTEEHLESINLTDDETEIQNQTYYRYIKRGIDAAESRGQVPDLYVILRNAILRTYMWDIIMCTLYVGSAEIISVFYSWFIGILINYISDETAPAS